MKVEYIGKRSEKWRWSMLRWYECQVNIYFNEFTEYEVLNVIEQYLIRKGGLGNGSGRQCRSSKHAARSSEL